ncbi:protein ASPARTIC PROTEASE IN GUARD CELL 2-like [Miscanthus floridulus]|uniref:protein ASPARTIC PROTEASE IN GUARD CELL 2-like n=1 Tax=Miscanthus floridulus TaxID=154761 RepID=UPI00345A4BD6
MVDLMARDSARAEYLVIVRRLSPTYQSTDFFSRHGVEKVVSGLNKGSGGKYFVQVDVGSPPTEQHLVVDSDSDVIWECYTQADPLFHHDTSTTFSSVSCGSAICRTLRISG